MENILKTVEKNPAKFSPKCHHVRSSEDKKCKPKLACRICSKMLNRNSDSRPVITVPEKHSEMSTIPGLENVSEKVLHTFKRRRGKKVTRKTRNRFELDDLHQRVKKKKKFGTVLANKLVRRSTMHELYLVIMDAVKKAK